VDLLQQVKYAKFGKTVKSSCGWAWIRRRQIVRGTLVLPHGLKSSACW
jgi:hypothetical protein